MRFLVRWIRLVFCWVADFSRGDKVSFTDRHLQAHVGIITRCNAKTASIECDGEVWGVPYGGLRRVLDV